MYNAGILGVQTTGTWEMQMAGVAEVAEEGKHYDISKSGKVLCKVLGCISMFPGLAGYRRHSRQLHNLEWPAPKRKRHRPGDPDSEDNTAAGRRRKLRRKQPGDAHCPQYDRQRGTEEARWKFISQRKKREFLRKAEERIIESESLRPKALKPTFLILIMEKILPQMGYEVWTFLLDTSKFKAVTEMLECMKIQEMCREFESQNKDSDKEDGTTLLVALRFLKMIFIDGPVGEMINLLGHRELLIKETQEWMSHKAELVKFETEFDANQIRRDALNKYEEWERTQKDTSVRRIRELMFKQDMKENEGHSRITNQTTMHDIDDSGLSQDLQSPCSSGIPESLFASESEQGTPVSHGKCDSGIPESLFASESEQGTPVSHGKCASGIPESLFASESEQGTPISHGKPESHFGSGSDRLTWPSLFSVEKEFCSIISLNL